MKPPCDLRFCILERHFSDLLFLRILRISCAEYNFSSMLRPAHKAEAIQADRRSSYTFSAFVVAHTSLVISCINRQITVDVNGRRLSKNAIFDSSAVIHMPNRTGLLRNEFIRLYIFLLQQFGTLTVVKLPRVPSCRWMQTGERFASSRYCRQ